MPAHHAGLLTTYYLFAGLAPAAFALLLAVSYALWSRRRASGGRELLALMGIGAVWLACAFGELLAPTEALSVRFLQWAYLAIPWGPVVWLAFALDYTGRGTWRTNPGLWVVCGIAVVTEVLGLTLPLHDWMLTVERSVTVGPFRYNAVTFGPWFRIHIAASWVATVAGALLIVSEYARSLQANRRLAAWLAVSSMVPLAANVIYVLSGHPAAKLYTPLGFAAAALAFGIGIMRYRFLDLRPMARSTLIDRMDEGLLVLDGAGRVVDFNAVLGAQVGPGLRYGATLAEAVPVLAPLAYEAGGDVSLGARAFEWRATPIEASTESGRLVLLRDVTERRAAERALRAALDEVRLQNDELDAFAYTVAHDLKSPLQALSGYAEMLAGPDLPPEIRRRAGETVFRTAGAMDAIIDELLLLARVRHEAPSLEPVDMATVVARAFRRVEDAAAAAGATVETPAAWPLARGYAPWIEEVWANYLGNALKHGGEAPRVTLGADRDGSAVRFWVEDDGRGVADGHDVFAPLVRLDPDHAEGHGLGLSIVRRIVGRLGGAVGVERGRTGGARFWFTLPAARPEGAAAPGYSPSRYPTPNSVST